jgi:hypothetical protein
MIETAHNFDPAQFIWLWSKYATGLNDRHHCANCIRGRYCESAPLIRSSDSPMAVTN